ncbi:MAG: ROK family protein [Candidatus Omnitrophica bacterium]|nr:ROK family protein [Candidatus Omnitrophota bacterium]
MKQWIAGIDIGGTKIRVSLGTRKGRIIAKKVFPSQNNISVKTSLSRIDQAITELLTERRLNVRQLMGIGVAVPGAVDPGRQRIEKSPNLPSWEKFPLRKELMRRFRVPVAIENDANAAALGERYFGSGRGIDDFLYMTISTGIGSGIIANGLLIRGVGGTAGEIGHMTLVRNGLRCNCGKKGCLEAYSSGTAIARHVKRAMQQGAKSSFFKRIPFSKITGQLVSDAARAGDSLAIQARRLAADYLGMGLANVINLLNPKRIILGGGVMENIRHFWAPMMKSVRRETWPMAFKTCEIMRSRLGQNVGDLGAMALVLESQKGKGKS